MHYNVSGKDIFLMLRLIGFYKKTECINELPCKYTINYFNCVSNILSVSQNYCNNLHLLTQYRIFCLPINFDQKVILPNFVVIIKLNHK